MVLSVIRHKVPVDSAALFTSLLEPQSHYLVQCSLSLWSVFWILDGVLSTRFDGFSSVLAKLLLDLKTHIARHWSLLVICWSLFYGTTSTGCQSRLPPNMLPSGRCWSVHTSSDISKDKFTLNSFINDIFKCSMLEICRLFRLSKTFSLSSREIQTAVRFLFTESSPRIPQQPLVSTCCVVLCGIVFCRCVVDIVKLHTVCN